jgi:hypothetical protein
MKGRQHSAVPPPPPPPPSTNDNDNDNDNGFENDYDKKY